MNPDDPIGPIAANLRRVRAAIAAAAVSAGRRPEEIALVAVSKTRPPAALAAALAAGQKVFGENTVQEALTKIPHFQGRGVEWHFIGHLQSNKARFIPGNFGWLHSLDGVRLAGRLSHAAREKGAVVNTLIEVNITRDPRRHGVAPEALAPLVEELLAANLPGIRLRGLMAIGPHPATESEIRRAFADLHALRDDCRERFALGNFSKLSMGMSGDYVEAIKEGSTLVRIGTAIFGKRD